MRLLLRTALVLSLLLGCLAKAEGQGFVYPVGNVARQPTAALPNPNGYKLIQGFHNEFGHTGVDLANGAEGGDVHAIGPGTVSIRQDTATSKGWGNVVFIRHDLPDGPFYSLYAHMQEGSVTVAEGDPVVTGQAIGKVDCTGNTTGTSVCQSNGGHGSHLHFGVKRVNALGCGYITPLLCLGGDTFDNYLDPLQFVASHSALASFDFAVDFLSVAGNANGGGGFFDDFTDGSLTTPPTSNITCASPVSESGGFLHLTSADGADASSPSFLIDNCALGLNAPAFRLNDGSGNSVITASFRADVPGPGQGAGLQLFTFGTNTNEIVNINFSTGPFVVAVANPANGPQSVQAVPIDLTGVQRVMLRLTFNDATNQVTHSYSLNGGATFTDIVLPQPGKVMTTGSQAVVSVFGSVQLPTPP